MLSVIDQSDIIILNSVDSYLKGMRTPVPATPQEKLFVMQSARDRLYSDIAERVPRVASYILQSDIDEDHHAKGLFMALCNHAKDPVFIQILMQKLAQRNCEEENEITGALLTKILSKIMDDQKVETAKVKIVEKKSDKDKTSKVVEEAPANNDEQYKHIFEAIQCLLGNMASIIATRCGNITVIEATSIAACIVMDNKETIKEIIESDLPISAQIFDIVQNPTNLIAAALNLNKADYTKLTPNQSNFIETLKKWVYEKLNALPTDLSWQIAIAAYGGKAKPDTSMKLIQLKDCGTQYSNLLITAKQINN